MLVVVGDRMREGLPLIKGKRYPATLAAFECCFINSPLGGGIDPFSRGSLFSPKCHCSGGSVHRGQAREAVAGARDLPIHRGRGDKASYQGSQLRLFTLC